MRRLIMSAALAVTLGCFGSQNGPQGRTRIYVLKYGESKYPASLVNTLSRERLVTLNWLAYLVVSGNPPQRTLIDTGFDAPVLARQFGLQKTQQMGTLLGLVGLKTTDIHQVFLTHSHFDHAHNLPQFTNSVIYLQGREYSSLADKSIAAFLSAAKSAGNLRLIEPGQMNHGIFETIFTGGHTPGSQAMRLTANGRNYVFTGDECYFADACRAKVPLPAAAAHSPEKNRSFLRGLGESEVILAGHETRFTGGRWLNDYVYLIE